MDGKCTSYCSRRTPVTFPLRWHRDLLSVGIIYFGRFCNFLINKYYRKNPIKLLYRYIRPHTGRITPSYLMFACIPFFFPTSSLFRASFFGEFETVQIISLFVPFFFPFIYSFPRTTDADRVFFFLMNNQSIMIFGMFVWPGTFCWPGSQLLTPPGECESQLLSAPVPTGSWYRTSHPTWNPTACQVARLHVGLPRHRTGWSTVHVWPLAKSLSSNPQDAINSNNAQLIRYSLFSVIEGEPIIV